MDGELSGLHNAKQLITAVCMNFVIGQDVLILLFMVWIWIPLRIAGVEFTIQQKYYYQRNSSLYLMCIANSSNESRTLAFACVLLVMRAIAAFACAHVDVIVDSRECSLRDSFRRTVRVCIQCIESLVTVCLCSCACLEIINSKYSHKYRRK